LPSNETPLVSRSSAPADASAEFCAGVAPLTMKPAPGSLEHRSKNRIAHPVVRPGQPRAQCQHRAGVKQHLVVEAGAEFAPGVVGGAAGKAQPEAVAIDIGLVVVGRVETLRLGAEVCGALAPQPRSIYSGPEHHRHADARSRQGRLRATRKAADRHSATRTL